MIYSNRYFQISNSVSTKLELWFYYFEQMQSTGNRKTWARIPAQSKASFFPQKDFQIL